MKNLIKKNHKAISLFTVIAIAIFTVAALSISGYNQTTNNRTALAETGCITEDKSVKVNYPVSGYFIRSQPDTCAMTKLIQPMHQVGADTIISQGGYMSRMSAANLENETSSEYIQNKVAGYKSFIINTRSGLPYVKSKMVSVKSGTTTVKQKIKLVNAYLYDARITINPNVRKCADKSGSTKIGSLSFSWFLIPNELSASADTCESPTGKYDLVLTMVGGQDPIQTTISIAKNYGMQVYLGLPSIEDVPATMRDANAKQKFSIFSKIIIADWSSRYGANSAFAGMYQSTEANLTTNPAIVTLDLYNVQHKIIADNFLANSTIASKAVVLISPFSRTLKNEPHPATVADITIGAKKMAETAKKYGVKVIIAPQDGVGGGRVGLYTNLNATVRPYATQYKGTKITEVGVTSSKLLNKDVYMANTTDLFKAVVASGTETWANVESFTPGTRTVNGNLYKYKRGPTDKQTFDEQIKSSAPYVKKLISYSWGTTNWPNPAQNNETLFGAISRRGKAPLLSTVKINSGKINLVGYNLNTYGNSTVTVVDTSTNKTYRIKAERSMFKYDIGTKFQTVSVTAPSIKSGAVIRVQITNADGNRTSAVALRF